MRNFQALILMCWKNRGDHSAKARRHGGKLFRKYLAKQLGDKWPDWPPNSESTTLRVLFRNKIHLPVSFNQLNINLLVAKKKVCSNEMEFLKSSKEISTRDPNQVSGQSIGRRTYYPLDYMLKVSHHQEKSTEVAPCIVLKVGFRSRYKVGSNHNLGVL